ncbi:MAG: hypothetical protein N0E59_20355 [Candidatus Thiodiazotropha taylori]|nr:hypothetical protein [Candidatus Thiodiazotropha taylori]MCW4285469.1 hypothetical protein [Candidatus Thiodiazotropha taylori]
MNLSKLYVPDPQKWVRFYKHVAEGKIKLNSTNQMRGGGRVSHSFIAPIDKYLKQLEDSTSTLPPIKLVSSTEQIVDQAKSELKREGEDLKRVVQEIKSQTRSKHQTDKSVKRDKLKSDNIKKSPHSGKLKKGRKKSKATNQKQIGGKKSRRDDSNKFVRLALIDKK